MAQTPALFYQEGRTIDHTPAADVVAGQVLVINGKPAIPSVNIPANVKGAANIEGVFKLPKTSDVFAQGEPVFWNPAGDPVTGDAGSGAADLQTGVEFGPAVEAAATGDSYVKAKLVAWNSTTAAGVAQTATVAAAGTNQATAAAVTTGFTLVSAADGAKGVRLPAAAPGLQVEIKNNANAALLVYPATGDAINAGAANAAYSMAAFTSAIFRAYDGTTWFSVPLVAS